MTLVWMAFFQICYVALSSLRFVLMIKGKKLAASVISTLEIFIYITGLSLVLKYTSSALGLTVYSLSYGIGILLGIYIEQKIALGYITLQVVSECEFDIALLLRAKGYGVTTWIGEGAEGPRQLCIILAKRKKYAALKSAIQSMDPKAFIICYEPNTFVGGFWAKK